MIYLQIGAIFLSGVVAGFVIQDWLCGKLIKAQSDLLSEMTKLFERIFKDDK